MGKRGTRGEGAKPLLLFIMKMIRYVLGFAFTKDRQEVALIEKKRPSWMSGLYNGLGGKVEEGETAPQAMEREFREESGRIIPAKEWRVIATLVGRGYMVRVFATFSDEVPYITSTTDESVYVAKVKELNTLPIVPQIAYLIPLALDEEQVGVPVFNYALEA